MQLPPVIGPGTPSANTISGQTGLGGIFQSLTSLTSSIFTGIANLASPPTLKVKITQSVDSNGYEINPDVMKSELRQRNSQPKKLKVFRDDFQFIGGGQSVNIQKFNFYKTGELRQNQVLKAAEVTECLDIAQSASESHYRSFQRHAWSFSKYMEESLYGKSGYYTSRVQFGITLDFATAITCGDCLSHQIVDQAFIMYLRMVEAGDISANHFDIVECGAGTGEMAFKVLNYIEELKKLYPNDTMVQKFSNAVRYTIGEISPGLRAKQSQLNQRFIDQGKLTILPADARNLQNYFRPNQFNGLFVSNELPDAFPVHCLKVNTHNEVLVKNVLPLIHFDDIPDDLKKEIIDESRQLQAQYNNNHYYPNLISLPPGSNDYHVFPLRLIDKISDRAKQKLRWSHVYLPVQLYPEIMSFLKSNPAYLEQARQEKDFYVNLDAPNFMKGVSAILGKGFVMTVDYGSPFNMSSLEELRTFGVVKKDPQDPTKANPEFIEPSSNFHNYFQSCDITVSISFQTLAEATNDLELLGVFRQSELIMVMKDFSQRTFETRRTAQSEASFTVLIQAKKGTTALYGLPDIPRVTTGFQQFQGHLLPYITSPTEAKIRNLSRLYAHAWLVYEKQLAETRKPPSLEEFSNLCIQMYVEYLEPTMNVAKGILYAMTAPQMQFNEGHPWEKSVVKETIKAINHVKKGKR